MSELLQSVLGINDKGAAVALLGVILTSGVVSAMVTKLFEKGAKRDERVRDGYAGATAALVAWGEFAFRVARRTSDDADVLAGLAGRGHDAQEALACRRAWVVGESAVMGDAYAAIVAYLRPQVAEATKQAWTRSAVGSASGMVLSEGAQPPAVDVEAALDLWCGALRYRFGWRRIVFVPVLLSGALRRNGVLPDTCQQRVASRSWVRTDRTDDVTIGSPPVGGTGPDLS